VSKNILLESWIKKHLACVKKISSWIKNILLGCSFASHASFSAFFCLVVARCSLPALLLWRALVFLFWEVKGLPFLAILSILSRPFLIAPLLRCTRPDSACAFLWLA
jgi:hypothetical protein